MPEAVGPRDLTGEYAVESAPAGDYQTPATYACSSYAYGDWFGWYGPWNYAGICGLGSLPPATELNLGSNFWNLSGELDRALEQDWETFDRLAYVGSSYGAVAEDAQAAALPGGQAGSSSDTTFGARPTANTGVWAGTDMLASCSWTGEGSSTSGPIGPISTTSTTATTSQCSDVSSGPEGKSLWSYAQDAWNGVKKGCQAAKDFIRTDLYDSGTQKSHQYHGQGFNMGTGSGTLSQSIEIQNDRSQAAFSRATRGRTSQQTIDAGQNLAAAVNAPFDLVINHPDQYWKKVGEAATGIFWDAPKNFVVGTVQASLDPWGTTKGLVLAVVHYDETYAAVKADVTHTLLYGNEREQGEFAGQILLIFVPLEGGLEAGVSKIMDRAATRAAAKGVKLEVAVAEEIAEDAHLAVKLRNGQLQDLGPAKTHAGTLVDAEDLKIAERKVAAEVSTAPSSLTSSAGSAGAKLERGDVLASAALEKEVEGQGIRVARGTSESRRRLYLNNRTKPKDPSSFARKEETANALFGLDDAGRPVVFLRQDAPRIELLEEADHGRYFQEWAKGRRPESVEQLEAAWRTHLDDPKNRALIELQAAKNVRSWLQKNGGTAQEFRAVEQRWAHWEERFFLAKGKYSELP